MVAEVVAANPRSAPIRPTSKILDIDRICQDIHDHVFFFYSAGAQQQPKLRKEKDPKKRKSSKISMPPVHSPGLMLDRPASAGSNKGAASAAAVISATSLAMANVFTIEGGNLSATTCQGSADSIGFSGGNGTSTNCNPGIAAANGRNIRTKMNKPANGIRGFTESRAVQAAALSRALDCLKGNGLAPNKGEEFSFFPSVNWNINTNFKLK